MPTCGEQSERTPRKPGAVTALDEVLLAKPFAVKPANRRGNQGNLTPENHNHL